MKIALRADAHAALGLGHMKRCLSLAAALRTEGAEVRFYGRRVDLDIGDLTQAAGFAFQPIGLGTVDDEHADALAFAAAARRFEPRVVLADHYALGSAWHAAVRAALGTRQAAIDDLGDRPLAVDLLIDPNLADEAKHRASLALGARLLCGPRHALLAPAYAQAPRHVPQEPVRSIGIFMGGTDAADLSTMALAAVRVGAGFGGEIEIATTSGNPNLAALRAAATRDGATRLTLDQPDLAAFFARHGLHLGAGGGATWERCCIGAPTLAMLAAPNQHPVLLPLQHLGVARVIATDPPTAQDLAPALRELLADAPLRRSLSAHAQALVDGLGAARVAEALREH